MTPHINLAEVAAAYAVALRIDPADITTYLADTAHAALVAVAETDKEAARQAGFTEERLSHDQVTLNATDGFPLVVVGATSSGRFYFSRPAAGWLRPGHRDYNG